MIPDYQTLMRPVLESSASGEISIKNAIFKLANQFQLSEEERQELLPSGKQLKFANRVNWAKSYLKQAGLVKATKRGHFAIT
jgi:restriction system protein